MRVIPREDKPDFGITRLGFAVYSEDSTTYRSIKPNGKVWCEASSLTEVLERSEGMEVEILATRRMVRYTGFSGDMTPKEEALIQEWRDKHGSTNEDGEERLGSDCGEKDA